MRQYSKSLTRIIYYKLPIIALCVFIFWQSSYPGIISEPWFPYEDKVLHFLVYGFLAILCARDLKISKTFLSPTKKKIIAILFTSLYGLSDEVHQAFIPSRTASTGDFIADCIGSIIGCFLYFHLTSRNK